MITFSVLSDSITIDTPEYGYSTDCHFAISIVETENGYRIWDNGSSYDYRTCSIGRFCFSESDALSVETFFNSHRQDIITLNIGYDSGFFPFGPDYGDDGIFTIKLLNRKFDLYDQFNQFSKSFEFLMVSKPAYAYPTIIPQGDFSIGNVDGLMYPQTGINQDKTYGYKSSVSYGGDGYYVDKLRNKNIVNFVQNCNETMAAALMEFLTGSNGRGSDITLSNSGRYYLFGIENGSSGSYLCKNIKSVIRCTHIGTQQFEIPLSFWLKQ